MTLSPDFTILALETSCDETAAAVVRDGQVILSNVVASQMDMHRRYGGIVPEVASRQHILSLTPVVEEALVALPDGWEGIHAVAATYGPGLSGALLTGLNGAKAMAWRRGLPFIGVNHLDAHIYANWLIPTNQTHSQSAPQFPLVALVVSGGHTLLALLRNHGNYHLLGQTRDDAAGEAFDKVARILGLGYPGGPAIQQAATGVQMADPLPRAWLRDSYDFSFSGLKTAVLHAVQDARARHTNSTPRHRMRKPHLATTAQSVSDNADAPLTADEIAHLALAFQDSVVDVLVSKTIAAAQEFAATEILLAGGVAANMHLRSELTRRATIPVRYPPIQLCTDNAAMIAAAAYYRFAAGVQSGWDLDVVPGLRLGM